MRLLLDNHLPPTLCGLLEALGILSEHVRQHGLAKAKDSEILDFARVYGLIVVTADSDFPEMLALSGAKAPSVLYLTDVPTRPEPISILLANVLPTIQGELMEGAVVAVSPTRVRIRKLPI